VFIADKSLVEREANPTDPDCTADDVTLKTTVRPGTTALLRLTAKTASVRCGVALMGRIVAISDDGDQAEPPRHAGDVRGRGLVSRSSRVQAQFFWWSNCDDRFATGIRLRVDLAGETSRLSSTSFPAPPCSTGAGWGVSPWMPQEVRPFVAQRQLELTLRDFPRELPIGRTFDLVVGLRNPTKKSIRLEPCPAVVGSISNTLAPADFSRSQDEPSATFETELHCDYRFAPRAIGPNETISFVVRGEIRPEDEIPPGDIVGISMQMIVSGEPTRKHAHSGGALVRIGGVAPD
jgi:hypothetical protein